MFYVGKCLVERTGRDNGIARQYNQNEMTYRKTITRSPDRRQWPDQPKLSPCQRLEADTHDSGAPNNNDNNDEKKKK